jgi:hypothetical protein
MTVAERSPAQRKRRAKRYRAPTCRRELAIYNGQELLGIVKIAENITAYDPDGRRVGVFTSLQAASDALQPSGGREEYQSPRGSHP